MPSVSMQSLRRDAELAQPNIVSTLVLGSIHVEVNQATSRPGLGRALF